MQTQADFRHSSSKVRSSDLVILHDARDCVEKKVYVDPD